MSDTNQSTGHDAGQICSIKFEGRVVQAAVDHPNDQLQTKHRLGLFYEIEQLIQHRNLIFHFSTVLDVGANVGNHSLFYGAYTSASLIYPFEPNPVAYRVLKKTVALNNLGGKINDAHLGLAIGASEGTVYVGGEYENNLGARFLTAGPVSQKAENVRCVTLDSLQIEGPVSLIKIDIEGMEIAALMGAQSLIRTHRPAIAVEVNEKNEVAFWKWVEEANYEVINMFHESRRVRNYIMIPRRVD